MKHARTHAHTHTHTLTLSSHAVIKLSLRLIAKAKQKKNFNKLKNMMSLAEQRICIYCSFCEPVLSLVSRENIVLQSVYAGHWSNIWHSSSVDVVQRGNFVGLKQQRNVVGDNLSLTHPS